MAAPAGSGGGSSIFSIFISISSSLFSSPLYLQFNVKKGGDDDSEKGKVVHQLVAVGGCSIGKSRGGGDVTVVVADPSPLSFALHFSVFSLSLLLSLFLIHSIEWAGENSSQREEEQQGWMAAQ